MRILSYNMMQFVLICITIMLQAVANPFIDFHVEFIKNIIIMICLKIIQTTKSIHSIGVDNFVTLQVDMYMLLILTDQNWSIHKIATIYNICSLVENIKPLALIRNWYFPFDSIILFDWHQCALFIMLTVKL